MLLYGNGTFLQVVEGEAAVVDALLDKISRDPRHTGMKILRREAIDARQYPDWSMGFEQVTERSLQDVPGLRQLGVGNFNAEYLSGRPDLVETLLDRHRAPHWDPLLRELDARDKLINELRGDLAQLRNSTQMAALMLETVVNASADGPLEQAHLDLCRLALRSLR
jgi:hypothetical protein